ncbi:MAG: glutaminyl-peptide cyclotransferase [Gammaproteobacteria bacterium]|nr:glutaminyl-peptide cyclotransferase [Gammaproteobacteria bacterium]
MQRTFLINFVVLVIGVSFAAYADIAKSDKSSDEKCELNAFTAKIVDIFPHSRDNFTQGFAYESGVIYESTGLLGHSAVQLYGLDRPVKLLKRALPYQYFGEGLTIVDDKLVQLTYKSATGFVYEKATLNPIRRFNYKGEGWGLAYNGKDLIMSDGSNVLQYLDPKSFRLRSQVEVRRCGKALNNINELEFIKGSIYANIWQSNYIVIIDPASGEVTGEIDLNQITDRYTDDTSVDVLNGIAWDPDNDRMFITGKNWPHLYQIELVERAKP